MADVTYKSKPEFEGQGTRTIKDLFFPAQVIIDDPMRPGEQIATERLLGRGEVLPEELCTPFNLARGEATGAFYTTEELDMGTEPEQQALEAGEGGSDESNFTEWGEHELAEYIRENRPNEDETVAMAEEDPDTARRLLEAENIATGGDPRSGVVKRLNKIAGQQ